MYAASAVPSGPSTVRGRVVTGEGRRPVEGSYVTLRADSARVVVTDANGNFQFDRVAPGQYTLRVVNLAYRATTDTIVVPLNGRDLEIALRPVPSDPAMCVFERELAAEPALTLIRPETVTVERSFDDGVRLRHTVIAHATPTNLVLDSRIENIGRVPATITSLCYPSADAPVLRHYDGIGPTCYGMQLTLSPGDTLAVVTGGPLRGRPGRYQFRVHAIDPAVLNATLLLDLVFAKRP